MILLRMRDGPETIRMAAGERARPAADSSAGPQHSVLTVARAAPPFIAYGKGAGGGYLVVLRLLLGERCLRRENRAERPLRGLHRCEPQQEIEVY